MKAIAATWKNGQIIPDEPFDWPDGYRLLIEPLGPDEPIGIREEDWSNSPEAIADWIDWYNGLEPLDIGRDEEADLAAWRQKVKEYTIAHMHAGIDWP